MNKKNLWVIILILGFFLLDRIVKNVLLITSFQSRFLGWLEISLSKNAQIIFGYTTPSFLFYLIICLILIFLFYKWRQAVQQKNSWLIAGYSLIILGGASNLLDRIKYHFVIDYFSFLNLSVFNLADIMIWLGIIILIIYFWFDQKKQATK